ncbi:MAG: serine/threonine-protein phosphatase [Armatimonadetes bacterium]|nr:serine/threonine-protein phosphatase [Armatimonadota bacterium]
MEEITAEYGAEQLTPVPVLTTIPRVTVACKTDLGRVRENNEDKFEYFLTEDPTALASRGLIFIVCDGMGGHAAGQIASEIASKTFIDVYLHSMGPEPENAARIAVTSANRYVHDVSRTVPGRQGMGTTLSAMMLIQDRAVIAHVGDSRIYRLRGSEMQLLTRDHTHVWGLVEMGLLRADEVESHPMKHVLTRAMGTEPDVAPHIATETVEEGDTYLLCSDGIMSHVHDAKIHEILAAKTPSEAAWALVAAALQGGGTDNATAMVVRVDRLEAVEP